MRGWDGIFLHLICHDFRKIIGRTKTFEKYTSGVVVHGVRLLLLHPTALSPCRHGARRQESVSCASAGSAAPGPCRRAARRQGLNACHTVVGFFLVFGF
jgi:hypothetical protein